MKKPSKSRKPWSFVRTKADVLRERRMQVERLEKRCTLSVTPLAAAEVAALGFSMPEGDLAHEVGRTEVAQAGGEWSIRDFLAEAGWAEGFAATWSPLDLEQLPSLVEATKAVDFDLAVLDRLLSQPMGGRGWEGGDAVLSGQDLAGRGAFEGDLADRGSRLFDGLGEWSQGAMASFGGQESELGQFGFDLLITATESRGSGDGRSDLGSRVSLDFGWANAGHGVAFVIANFSPFPGGPQGDRPEPSSFGFRADPWGGWAPLFAEALGAATLAGDGKANLPSLHTTRSTPQTDSREVGLESSPASVTSHRRSVATTVGRETLDNVAASPSLDSTGDSLSEFSRTSDDEGFSLVSPHLDTLAGKSTVSYHTRTAVIAEGNLSEELNREFVVSSDMGQLDPVFYPVTAATREPNAVALLDIAAPDAALRLSELAGGEEVESVVSQEVIALDGVMAQAYAFSLDSIEDGQPTPEGETAIARGEPAAVPTGSDESTTADQRSAMQSSKPVSGIDAASLLLAAAPLAAKRRGEKKGRRSTPEAE
jgi:hypothetical protein